MNLIVFIHVFLPITVKGGGDSLPEIQQQNGQQQQVTQTVSRCQMAMSICCPFVNINQQYTYTYVAAHMNAQIYTSMYVCMHASSRRQH